MITMNKQNIKEVFFTNTEEETIYASEEFKRIEQKFDGSCSQLVDIHVKDNVNIYYLKISLDDALKKINIFKEETIVHALESNAFGMLLRAKRENLEYTVWLPVPPDAFLFDKNRRIATSSESRFSYQWEIYPYLRLNLLQPYRGDEVITIPYIVMEDPSWQFYNELKSLNNIESRLYLKANYFVCEKPSDVWSYLINGSVYDPRSKKGIDKRFKCQQCAFAWWSYFGFLHRETGKKVYDILQDEVAYTILLDMSNEGEWGHGFWSDDIETHARFHLDGAHLLISQYEKSHLPVWREAAERCMDFVAENLMEVLDDGNLWFLHDSLEINSNNLHGRFKSTLFGKTLGNTLCINTHVQALTVLHRLKDVTSKRIHYAEMFEKGARALRMVLDYQPGEVIYKLLFPWIIKNKTSTKPVSVIDKLKNSMGTRITEKIYYILMSRYFPRFVLPGGFIERDLTCTFFKDVYHIINLKDLLTLYQQEQFGWLRPYIKNGLEFTRKFIGRLNLTHVFARDPHYIEYLDILYLYDKLIERIPLDEIESVERNIYQQTGGFSLDYYASELVRGH